MTEKKLSVLVLVTNEEHDLPSCIESARGVADEFVVIDGGSSDQSVAVAEKLGAKVFRRPFDNFTDQRAYGLSVCQGEWILSLDADERLTSELFQEITRLTTSHDGYQIPFQVLFMGRAMRFSGLGDESHLRLFRKDKVALASGHLVHEVYQLSSGKIGALKGKITHRPYRDITEYLMKCELYANLWAEDFIRKNKKLSWRYRFVVPYEFLRCYVLALGFLDGLPGFVWAGLSAYHRSVRIGKMRSKEAPKQRGVVA